MDEQPFAQGIPPTMCYQIVGLLPGRVHCTLSSQNHIILWPTSYLLFIVTTNFLAEANVCNTL